MPSDEHGSMSLSCPSGDTDTAGRSSSSVAFTADQRQELERQTIIYKYMMASMPVPPQLLLPLSKYPTTTATTTAAASGGRGGGGDPEPWRCRRTDGKKWRCSRDVAPDQKYCERHSHKGRPSARSRKPVESILSPPTPTPTPTSASYALDFSSPLLQYNLRPNASYRYPERLMKKDALPAPVSLAAGSTHQCHQRAQLGAHNPHSIHEDQSSSRPFIDAWSLSDHANDPTSNVCTSTTAAARATSPIHSILPLTLSVSSGTGVDDHADIPGDVNDHQGHQGQAGVMRLSSSSSQPLNWMTSWISSPPGGPLAEALCLGMSGVETTGNDIRNNFEELVSSPLLYGRSSSSTSSAGSKDTNEQNFRLQ